MVMQITKTEMNSQVNFDGCQVARRNGLIFRETLNYDCGQVDSTQGKDFGLRLPTPHLVCKSLAVAIKVTGKTATFVDGGWAYRCQIIYLGDGENNTAVAGWLWGLKLEGELIWRK